MTYLLDNKQALNFEEIKKALIMTLAPLYQMLMLR